MGTLQTSAPLTFHTPGATTTMSLEPISELTLPWIDPSRFLHIKQIIERHGGKVTIDYNTYHFAFPEGTVQKKKDHMTGVSRQKIIFPDGWWLLYEPARGSGLPQMIVDAPQEGAPDV